jgi:TRAP-type mannitol/chloroaromatic compound transport system permease small subunit
MPHPMQTITRLLDALNEWIGRAVAWLTLGMVLVTFAVVVLRYGFDTGWIAMQESVTYMHAVVFMLGAAYTLKHNGHVRVDIFYHRMSARGQALVNMLGDLLLLLPVCIYILLSSWDYVAVSWSYRETSNEPGGLPWVYLLKTSLLLMPALLILQAFSGFLSALLVYTGRLPPLAEESPEI